MSQAAAPGLSPRLVTRSTGLNVLSRYIPPTERLVRIEDAAELQLQQPHVVRMESRAANLEGHGVIAQRDLLQNALRMRPDRIILGESRGPEAIDMLQAMNTGHEGSITTVYANDTRDALNHLELMIGLSGVNLAVPVLRGYFRSVTSLARVSALFLALAAPVIVVMQFFFQRELFLKFVYSPVGTWVIGAAVVLEVLGLLWLAILLRREDDI
ncbi:MAG TPA: ATPase, T2SS/T4P/T4SS family [Gemmataceae bacterium]|nr:ATPase, T2SS/T4P/T4SS family [Gemmataceae bacterium]